MLEPNSAALLAPAQTAQRRVKAALASVPHRAAAAAASSDNISSSNSNSNSDLWWVPAREGEALTAAGASLRGIPGDPDVLLQQLQNWPRCSEVQLELVDTPTALQALADQLMLEQSFSFDVENHSYRSYHGLTCLLQIGTDTADYVVDPLAPGMWDAMAVLRKPFADPSILKVSAILQALLLLQLLVVLLLACRW
jgi:3'-5' exonuclease